jgi:hypothetical protein
VSPSAAALPQSAPSPQCAAPECKFLLTRTYPIVSRAKSSLLSIKVNSAHFGLTEVRFSGDVMPTQQSRDRLLDP